MKVVIALSSILVVISFSVEAAVGQQKGSRVPQGPPPWLLPKNQQVEQKKEREQEEEKKEVGDVNSDVNSADVNSVIDLPQEVIDDLDRELLRLEAQGEEESRFWSRCREEDKGELLEMVREQATAELKFLQELADEEGAKKTSGAIEMLLARQKERYERVAAKLEKDKERILKREEKEKKRDRGSRSRERTTRPDSTRRRTPGSPF